MVQLVALVVFAGPSDGWTQEQPKPESGEFRVVQPSDEQLALNDEGVEALIEGNYARAVAHFEQALLLGEFNVTYLNLGRAYQRLGECQKAQQALGKVKTSPRIENPPVKVVNRKAKQYLVEIGDSCIASEGIASDDTATVYNTHNIWGWTATAAGGVVAGTGVGLHFVAESKRDSVRNASTEDGLITSVSQSEAQRLEDDANTLDTVGAAMTVTGLISCRCGHLFAPEHP
jgi:tetratricopeptide (TPR) repeat protein